MSPSEKKTTTKNNKTETKLDDKKELLVSGVKPLTASETDNNVIFSLVF